MNDRSGEVLDPPAPMRLLFLATEHASRRGTGGIGSYVATMSGALARRGHDVHVLSCHPEADWTDDVVDGVALHTRPLVRLRGLSRVVRGQRTRRRLLLAISNYRHARALGSFDAVEAPEWQAEGLLFALRRRAALVVHLHTPDRLLLEYNAEPRPLDARLADRLERYAARRAAVVTCPSQLLVDELRRREWLGDAPTRIIRYPVDWARFQDTRSAEETAPLVLVVGRLERRKAPEQVVRALAALDGQGVTAEVVFAGRSSGTRDGVDYGEWVRRLAAETGVTTRFAGELLWEDLPELYAGSRVVCVPSVFESFSMAAAEAMAAARPLVLSARVGAAELLAGSADSQVVSTDADSLAAALRTFLTDPVGSARVGKANRTRVADECDPDLVAGFREQMYRTLGSRR